MSASVAKMIRDECEHFCEVKGMQGMENELYKLAIVSYYALPKHKRSKWTLEEVVKQGL